MAGIMELRANGGDDLSPFPLSAMLDLRPSAQGHRGNPTSSPGPNPLWSLGALGPVTCLNKKETRRNKMAYQTFQAEYLQMPAMTRAYTTACVLTTLSVVSSGRASLSKTHSGERGRVASIIFETAECAGFLSLTATRNHHTLSTVLQPGTDISEVPGMYSLFSQSLFILLFYIVIFSRTWTCIIRQINWKTVCDDMQTGLSSFA